MRRTLIAVALATVAAVAYAPAVRLPFVNFDDNEYVRNNAQVLGGLSVDTVRWAFAEPHEVNYFPLTWVSLAADASISGPDLSRTMHRTNVILHAASAALLFLLLATSTGNDGPSALVAAVFAVHPAHVESVAWVSERKDVLCGLFYLLAIAAHVAYARSTTPPRRWVAYALTFLAGVAALLSKPMAVTLPAVLVVVDFWPLRRLLASTVRRSIAEQLPLLVASAVLSWVTYVAQASAGAVQTIGDRPLSVRVRHVPVDYVRYLGKIVWPTDLSPYYPFRADLPLLVTIACTVALVVATWAALNFSRRFPFLAAGWFWFGITLLPVIGIVSAGRQSIADRYLYLPLIGPAIAVAWAARAVVRGSVAGRVIIAVAAVAVVVSGIVATRHQLGCWRDTRTLFAHALDVDPDNAFAHAQLGYLDKVDGQMATARSHYERAVRLDPGYADASYNLANMVLPTDPAAAARYYRMTLAVRPHDPRVENNLGVALSVDPARASEAAAMFRAASTDDPGWADPHLNLGKLLLAHGRADLAAIEFAAAGRRP